MISRKDFVETLLAIKKEQERTEQAQKQLSEIGLSVGWENTPYLQPLLKLLEAATPDPYGYISWWLYEDVSHDIEWEEGEEKKHANVDDPNDLYDFLMSNYTRIPPLFDLSDEEGAFSPVPKKGIEEVDFSNYMDEVLQYCDDHDEIIHITREGKGKYVLMSVSLYERLFGKLTIPSADDHKVTMEIEVDAELAEQARAVFAKAGFTLEQAVEMFMTWCAHYPEDAKAWLKRAMEEQGIVPAVQ